MEIIMSSKLKVGTYVKTPNFGKGVVRDIEIYKDTGRPSGRYGVKLDEPDRWACSKDCNGTAYFYRKDLRRTKRKLSTLQFPVMRKVFA
jgi:hypothetical protein